LFPSVSRCDLVIGAMAMMIGYSMLTVNVRRSRLILGAPVVQF
jgi:hypothetical protein